MHFEIIARDYGSPFIHQLSYLDGTAGNDLGKIIKRKPSVACLIFNNRHFGYSWDIDNIEKDTASMSKLIQNPGFLKSVRSKSIESIHELERKIRLLQKTDASKLSVREIEVTMNGIYAAWREMNLFGHLVNLADFFNSIGKVITRFLEEKKAQGAGLEVGEAFSKLTSPLEKSKIMEQELSFYNLLALIQANKKLEKEFKSGATKKISKSLKAFPFIEKAFKTHAKNFDWLSFSYDGPTILDEDYFIGLLSSEARQGIDGKQKLRELQEYGRETALEQKKLLDELKPPPEIMHFIEVAKTSGYLKAYRKETTYWASRHLDSLIKEIAKRLYLSPLQVRHMTVSEMISCLKKGKADADWLNDRIKTCVVTMVKGKAVIFSGKKAEKWLKLFKEQEKINVTELKGETAFPGKAKGVVKLIEQASDIPKMRKGDILASASTNPSLLPAMKLASAIVTDEGGVVCHAAIVSRELKIPCVVGTKIASRALHDGDIVEVDAVQGTVKIISKGERK